MHQHKQPFPRARERLGAIRTDRADNTVLATLGTQGVTISLFVRADNGPHATVNTTEKQETCCV